MYIILVYDIIADKKGAYISRNVFKICKRYLSHIQKSVFEGELTPAQLIALRSELSFYLRQDQDSVILFKSRSDRWLEKEFWGIEIDVTGNLI